MALLDEFSGLMTALTQPSVLVEVAVVVGCVALAWVIAHLFRRNPGEQRHAWTSQHAINSVMFPVLALVFVMAARWLLRDTVPAALMRIAIPILASLVVVRVVARGLRAAFPNSAAALSIEKTFSWVVWGLMVLWVTGLLPTLLTEAEEVKWAIGGSVVSLRSLVEGVLSAGAVFVAMLWLSSLIESRLLAGSTGDSSLRKIAANGARALLLIVGVLLALTAAGIPVSALGVFGGAIGVGIGLGLQKLAANYVSGFVILAERSLRIGDIVKVDGFEGRITDIATRYTVVRSLDGRESIVPNEILLTQRVENHSLANRHVLVSTAVQVAYGTDVDALILALEDVVMHASERVLKDPPPGVLLREFEADGLKLQIVFWIGDPENGQGSVRSDVNRAVLRKLNALGIEIPFPQRVVRLQAADLASADGQRLPLRP